MFSKNKLLYIVLLVSIIYALGSSFLWEKTILGFINRSISKSKVEVISGELSGNLLRNIIGKNFEIVHPDYGNIYIDNFKINTFEDLISYLALNTEPGDIVKIEVVRDYKYLNLEVNLEARPD